MSIYYFNIFLLTHYYYYSQSNHIVTHIINYLYTLYIYFLQPKKVLRQFYYTNLFSRKNDTQQTHILRCTIKKI